MIYRFVIFFIINFSALGLGSLFTGKGVPSDWYQNLEKAPWTPPGWAFGAAWTTIMVCFSFYMMYAWDSIENRKQLLILFSVQWILNVLWNPVFFKYHQVGFGLGIISFLTLLMAYFLMGYFSDLKLKSLLVTPYVAWLVIATSLNAFIYFRN